MKDDVAVETTNWYEKIGSWNSGRNKKKFLGEIKIIDNWNAIIELQSVLEVAKDSIAIKKKKSKEQNLEDEFSKLHLTAEIKEKKWRDANN